MTKSEKSAQAQLREMLNMAGEAYAKSGDAAQALNWQTYLYGINPGGDLSSDSAKSTAYTQARRYVDRHFWLREFVRLKEAIMLYGLTIVPAAAQGKRGGGTGARPARAGKGDVAALDGWLNTPITPEKTKLTDQEKQTLGIPSGASKSNEEHVLKFIWDATREIIIQTSCIAYWSKDTRPICLELEKCRYLDTFGIERLFYTHGLSSDQKKLLPPEQAKRFEKSEVPIDSEQNEFFKVYKDERAGFNLGWPSVQPLFNTLETTLNMEAAELVLSYLGRTKFRHWKMGYEIKNGPHAGKRTNHMTEKRAAYLSSKFEHKVGCMGNYITNFDVTVEHPVEPTEYYNEDKWKSSLFRFVQWGGAVAKLAVSADGVTPYLTKLLKAEILNERRKLKMFLDSVLQQGFSDAPVPMQVKFSNMIFMDSRLEAEINKAGLAGGPISQSTWREESGFDDEREKAKKEQEAKDVKSNRESFAPAFDAAHGADQGLNPSGGAPAGGQNKDNAGARNA